MQHPRSAGSLPPPSVPTALNVARRLPQGGASAVALKESVPPTISSVQDGHSIVWAAVLEDDNEPAVAVAARSLGISSQAVTLEGFFLRS